MNRDKIRLNRFLAMSGIGSRRKCDDLIAGGAVRVNGKVVTEMGVQVDPSTDVIEFDGQRIESAEKPVYILLNKPRRIVTTASDEKKRRTVLNIVDLRQRVFPVGRLDYNTTGALLLTNDGDLSYFLSHPRYEITKIYHVLLDRRIRPIDLHHFQRGIELDGHKTAACRAEEIRIIDNSSFMEVELHEGRNRQIRRMFEVLGYLVKELHRYEFAGLRVNDLREGEWRRLTPAEVNNLKRLVGKYKNDLQEKADKGR